MANTIFRKRSIALNHDTIVSGKGAPFGCVLFRHFQMIGRGYYAVTGTNDTTHILNYCYQGSM